MAIRIAWDMYEAAVLLEALVNVYQNKLSRNEAIILVSNKLRKRAIKKGTKIDEIFRNVNGITLQMSVMEYIFTNGAKGLKKPSMPKLFDRR